MWLYVDGQPPNLVWDRKVEGGFPELKVLVRNNLLHVAGFARPNIPGSIYRNSASATASNRASRSGTLTNTSNSSNGDSETVKIDEAHPQCIIPAQSSVRIKKCVHEMLYSQAPPRAIHSFVRLFLSWGRY